VPSRFGPFELTPETYELRCGGSLLRVEPKVIEALAYLVAHRDRIVRKDELFAVLWPGQFASDSALTRLVRDARRALREGGSTEEWIQTVYGRGFRFVGEVEAGPGGSNEALLPPVVPRPAERAGALWGRAWVGVAAGLLGLGVLAYLALGARRPGPAPPAEAYQLYLRAVEPLRRAVCEGRAPLALLQRSLELDPSYTPAWEELGWAHYNLVSSCGESGTHYSDALRAADRALAQRPGSPHALGLKAAVLTETGRVEDAYALVAQGPAREQSAELAFFEGYALTYAGFLPEAAERMERALRIDPAFLTAGGWTPNALLYLGEDERFLSLLPDAGSPLQRYYRGYALARRGRTDEALRVLQPAYRERPGDVFARLARALAEILAGRGDAASLILRQLADQRRELGASDGELTFKVAQLLARAGEPEAARAELELAIAQGFFCPRCYLDDPDLAAALTRAGLGSLVGPARQRHVAFGRRFRMGADREAGS
jgi:DNA-binding winged helix-turn-helix (wHTH) protein/tetratricopeptide (TPR) repeat protein